MPAAFTIKAENWNVVVSELKRLDTDLFNQMRREFRQKGSGLGKELANNIPSAAPLSGFTKAKASDGSFYVWRKPTVRTKVSARSRGRRRRGYKSLVSLVFSDRRPTAGFSILELAGTQTPNNRLEKGLRNSSPSYPLGKGGRWVIPQFYDRQDEVTRMAVDIVGKYADKLNRKFKLKGNLKL